MVRLVVAADLHLDATMIGGWDTGEGVHSNWLESFTRLDELIRATNEEDADYLLIAGDVFHTGVPQPEAVARARQAFGRLARARVLMVDGNHDQTRVVAHHHTPLGAYFAGLPWCERVAPGPEVYDADGLAVALVPWHRVAGSSQLGSTERELSDSVARLGDEMSRRDGPGILIGHVALAEAVFSSGVRADGGAPTVARGSEMGMSTAVLEAGLPVRTLDQGPWAAARLGHIHKRQQVSPMTGYVGSTYRVDFGEKAEPKGCDVIDISDSGECRLEFREFAARQLVEVDLSAGAALLGDPLAGLGARDVVRLQMSARGTLSDSDRAVMEDLRSRGVTVQTRRLREQEQERRLPAVRTDTDPRRTMELYLRTELPEDPKRRRRLMEEFDGILSGVDE